MSIHTLFDGVTISPAREFVANVVNAQEASRAVLPCAGRFAACAAVVQRGMSPEKVYASDITLFSSVLGYLFDTTRSISDLQIRTDGVATEMVGSPKDDYEHAAGVLLAMHYLGLKVNNAYKASIARELYHGREGYREHIAGRLRHMGGILSGIHYEIADFRDVVGDIAEANDPATVLYVNPPGYRGGYTKMYEGVEKGIRWAEPDLAELDPDEVPELLDSLSEKKSLALVYRRNPDEVPASWYAVYAHAPSEKRVDYIFSNREIDQSFVKHRIKPIRARMFEIYDDQEITPETTAAIVKVDRDTCLYYRDLFVHRLGTTDAEIFYLMLLDGRVVTAFGLNR